MNERKKEIVRLYFEEGLTYQEIGDQYGISRQRVAQILEDVDGHRHWGVAKRRKSLAETVSAHERVRSGETTLQDEADRAGVSKHTLYVRMRDAGLLLPRPTHRHGTVQRYYVGCKCEACLKANARLARTRRKLRTPPEHGTNSGYVNWGCRCQACKEAHRTYERNRLIAKRREKMPHE